jgi:origin recognition complex subunit 1
MKIIQSRLEGVPGNVVEADAVQFASRKVAAVSGDARRALDICRRAVELAEADSQGQEQLPGTPSKKAKSDNALPGIAKPDVKVTIATVKRAIDEATSSPLQQYLRALPLSSKVLLGALLAKVRRTGLTESVLGEVIEEAKRMAQMAGSAQMQDHLLTANPTSNTTMVTSNAKTSRILAMGGAAVELMEAGIIGLEARRGERTGKVRLNIGEEEVKLALKDDPEVRGLGFSS